MLRWEGTLENQLVQPPVENRVSYSRLLTVMASWVLNVSKDEDSTASLCDLFQVFDHHHNKGVFSYVKMEFAVFEQVPVASCPHWALLERIWLHLLILAPHTLIRPPEPSPG